MATLDEFEARLQALLEVHLLKHLPGYRVEDGIVQQLAAAMHDHLKEEREGTLAPNLYVVIAHPTTLTRWHAEPRLLKELANDLYVAGDEAGFRFLTKPIVTTTSDATMPADDVRVIASFINENVAETYGKPAKVSGEPAPGTFHSNAFLIIGGTQVVPLDRSVINIGRRLDNHITVDDPRVSRAHAQLRFVKDRFILFDLNSSGGTFVNGQRTNQAVLSPGDVVSLAGVTLIFGQDSPAGHAPDKERTDRLTATSDLSVAAGRERGKA